MDWATGTLHCVVWSESDAFLIQFFLDTDNSTMKLQMIRSTSKFIVSVCFIVILQFFLGFEVVNASVIKNKKSSAGEGTESIKQVT